MKALMLNGSPHPAGCTYTALREVAGELEKAGIEPVWFQIGTKPVRGCIACYKCAADGRCVFDDDPANALRARIWEADALVIGSPVYYAGPNGALCALLDRVFFAAEPDAFARKPAAAVVSCRRGGASAAFDRLNKYFTISGMPVAASQYWNAVHGNTPDEVRADLEGMQIMRTLGKNLAWMLQSFDAAAIAPMPREPRVSTNFIREV